ncbi:alpha/beta hydrolase [Streptomyces alanosinicus]|uniref:Esterase n=1 Tax=Streptomyces alanosinicus TaxID=68171 RepID=A0A918YIF6_9ACTN|nr:alpha/beta hydrolase fold domain-containing protein [Streptomyces alanosinicus]GHE05050.1 esterase [Streptomyces alanosinicus]
MDLADDVPSQRGPAPVTWGAPPLDPELALVLADLGDAAREPFTAENLAARQERDRAGRPRPTVRDLQADGRFEVAELRVPGPPGSPEVTLVSARPAGADGPLPLLYYLHGGGMIMGNAWSVLPRLLDDWAAPLELAVVSVEYRLAPKARYPAAVEDCYAGLVWVAGHAAELGVDARRIVVGGKSAGGGLAAALALLTRDRGGPAPAGQLLLCPMLDDRGDTVSSHQLAGVDTWDRVSSTTAWQALLGDRYGAADLPPYAAPARATDLSALPPAYVDVGSAETLRDEGVAYAQAIWRAGGQAELHVWPGAFHGFDTVAPRAALSRDARDARTRWLRRVIAPSGTRAGARGGPAR